MPDLLEVGRVTKSHGVRGEVLVKFTTDRNERWSAGARLRVGDDWMTVLAGRVHHERHIVAFEGIGDRNAADLLRGKIVSAEPIDDPEALFVHVLVGTDVVEVDGTRRGTVRAVIENPASDLLELDTGALVPLTFVVERRRDEIVIEPPAGLFDL